jgi:hypothetical protein
MAFIVEAPGGEQKDTHPDSPFRTQTTALSGLATLRKKSGQGENVTEPVDSSQNKPWNRLQNRFATDHEEIIVSRTAAVGEPVAGRRIQAAPRRTRRSAMAKDRFYRSKPHVNVGLLPQLDRLGFTSVGSHQLLFSLRVTNPADQRMLDILVEPYHPARLLPTGKRQHKPFTVTKPVEQGEVLLSLLSELGPQRFDLSGGPTSKHKRWLTSNFRIRLGDLPAG